jgi:hypothetical protein
VPVLDYNAIVARAGWRLQLLIANRRTIIESPIQKSTADFFGITIFLKESV